MAYEPEIAEIDQFLHEAEEAARRQDGASKVIAPVAMRAASRFDVPSQQLQPQGSDWHAEAFEIVNGDFGDHE